MKSLIKLFGFNIERMAGKRVELYVEAHVQAFGKDFDCIRFRAASGNGRSLMPAGHDAPKSKTVKDLDDEDDAATQRMLEARAAEEADLAVEAREHFKETKQEELPA